MFLLGNFNVGGIFSGGGVFVEVMESKLYFRVEGKGLVGLLNFSCI